MQNPTISFHPEFTHQVFHEDEVIFGYEDLAINIYLLGGSLKPYVDYTYTKKHPYADNIEDMLSKNLFVSGEIFWL